MTARRPASAFPCTLPRVHRGGTIPNRPPQRSLPVSARERSRGGAKIADTSGQEVAFSLREQQNLSETRAIAALAYGRLRPGSTVLMGAGTTVLQLARCIRLRPIPLSVFTNCIPVAQVLMDVPDVKVSLLGGMLRAENASMVGVLAERMLLIDSGKFGRHLTYRVSPLRETLDVITDSALTQDWQDRLAEQGIAVELAQTFDAQGEG
ncbi:DeoR/GlpR transcriptional regulator [Thioclava sp. BHET1]|nr:DeoR/GlpR transcriptional regulator [Thioclava sp. BHET1]